LRDSAPAFNTSTLSGENMLRNLLKLAPIVLVAALATAQMIPAGTRITVRTGSSINSGSATSGQAFAATLARALVVNGKTLAAAGTPVRGKVTYAKSSGRLHAPGELTVRLTALEVDGKMIPIATSGFRAKGKSHTKSNVTKIGGGAAAGTLIGALAGGGKGALIGAAAGTAAGTGLAAATGKQEAVIPAESALTFTTTRSATVK
jgi:hypothetical protein